MGKKTSSVRLPGHRGAERLQEHAEGKIGEPLERVKEDLRHKHTSRSVWLCIECGYRNVDEVSGGACQNCGRNFMGEPGKVPDRDVKEARAGLRDDVSQGFADFTPP